MSAAFEKAWSRSGPKEGLGKWTDHPDDLGGETYTGMARNKRPDWVGWGDIDRLGATAGGKVGPSRVILPAFRALLDQHQAELVALVKEDYRQNYWLRLGLDRMPERIALELFDTGLNQGTGAAANYLQRWLNVFNRQGKLYPDVKVDGDLGPSTHAALAGYLKARGAQGGETVLYNALNCSQGHFYLELAERKPGQEENAFGWLSHRVMEG